MDKEIYNKSEIAGNEYCVAHRYCEHCSEGDQWFCVINQDWICNEDCPYKGKRLTIKIFQEVESNGQD